MTIFNSTSRPKKYLLTMVFTLTLWSVFAQKTYIYPTAPKDSTIDVYFGIEMPDPYQWMENPNDPRLGPWLDAQESITKKVGHQQVKTATLNAQLSAMYYGVKEQVAKDIETDKKKSKYRFKFYSDRYNRPPDLLYKERGHGIFKTLVKVKNYRHWKGDNVRVFKRFVNEEDDLAAVELIHSGSDWSEVYIFDLKTGKQLPDTLKYLRRSNIIWHGKDVYYTRYSKSKTGRESLDVPKGETLNYHRFGTPQSEDLVLYQSPDTSGSHKFHFFKYHDKLFIHHYYKYRGKYLRAISIANDDSENFLLKNFLIYPNDESIDISISAMFGDTVIMKTNWNAPNGKVLLADINQLNQVVEIIPEYDIVLREVNPLGKDKIACVYSKAGNYHVLIFNLAGELLKKIDFPEGKMVKKFSEESTKKEYTKFSVSSFYHPDLWFQLSLKDLTYKPITSLSVPYDPNSLETKYVEYTSKDGTQVPMYITMLKNTKLDGKNPVIIYVYGGYGTVVEPDFVEAKALWVLHGGILAIPNIRGGGVGGSDWSLAGRRLSKQNAIDDVVFAAEYLIDKKYTNPEKLAINGRSHGGLMVGAAITQRPELFKVAIAEAGVFDMLRFEKFTSGGAQVNINEFGTVSDSSNFVNLKSYSPLLHIKEGVKYPDLLLIAGNRDERVPPFHSYKFLATLQEKGSPESLYLLYTISNSGHDKGQTSEQYTEYLLFKYYFLFDQLDFRFY